MKINIIKPIAEMFCAEYLGKFFKRMEIVGSIRRGKAECHDIDIVAIPKDGLKFEAKILKMFYSGLTADNVQIEIYIADENTFETLKLIRTGSAEHNKMLCSIAKKKGWKLKANGEGLIDENEKIISNTEEGILKALLGKWVPPEEREVF